MSTPQTDPAVSNRSGGLLDKLASLLRSRGVWVLIDQAVVSAGNFATAILLGRHLSQAAYGSYGMLLENMLLLNSLQAALIIYPYSVKGAGEPARLQRLTTASVLLTLVMFPLLAAGMVGVAAVSGVIELSGWAIVAIICWQLQETVRRGLMADLRFADAIWGDALSYLGQTAVVGVLGITGNLTLGRALVAITVTSAAGAILQTWQIRPQRLRAGDLAAAVREFWVLGRWALLTSMLVLVSGTAYMWVLKYGHGLETVGAFVAIYSVMKLTHPLMSSATSLIQPAVARARRTEGVHAAVRVVWRYSMLGLLLVPFYAFLLVAPAWAMRILFGEGTPYVAYANLLRLYVLSYSIVFVNAVAAATLGGLERPRYGFIAQLVNAVLSIAVGLPLTWLYGLPGLIVGGLMSIAGVLVAHVYFLRRAFREPPPQMVQPRGFDVRVDVAQPLETGGPP